MLLTISFCLALQDAQSPPQDVLVRLDGGVTVTVSDYRAYLHEVIGTSRLEELILDKLMSVALDARDLERVSAAVRGVLADPDAAVTRALAARVRDDYGGDRALWLDTLRRIGRTEREARTAERIAIVRAARTAALVQLDRVADDTALRRLFDQDYGVDGRRVRIRQLFVPFADARRRLEASPRRVGSIAEKVESMTRSRAASLREQLDAGIEFDALGPVAVPNYNYQQFGTELADVVRAMKPGEVRGPLRTDYGYHIVRLDAREVTRFADVAEALVAKFRTMPATLGEKRRLRERLFQEHGVDAALARSRR